MSELREMLDELGIDQHILAEFGIADEKEGSLDE